MTTTRSLLACCVFLGEKPKWLTREILGAVMEVQLLSFYANAQTLVWGLGSSDVQFWPEEQLISNTVMTFLLKMNVGALWSLLCSVRSCVHTLFDLCSSGVQF